MAPAPCPWHIAAMHYLLTALGSYGDIHPMIGLGQALRRRGARVTLAANPHFADVIEGAGLELAPLLTAEDYAEMTQHPRLWHPRKSLKVVFEWATVKALRPLYELIQQHYIPGETVIGAHGLDVASRIAADAFGAQVASIVYAPQALWSDVHPPKMTGGWTGPEVPRWLNRFQLWLGNQLLVNWKLADPVNQFRQELDLPPIKNFFPEWWYDNEQTICLFPEWFAPRQPDWPPGALLTGFPLWDGGDDAPLPTAVEHFLSAGTPPIVFTPGTANRMGAKFFATAAEVCAKLGRRGIFLTKYAEQVPAKLPAEIAHFSFVPLSQLLPRCAAFVHHGGIGSCAQGLAAGLPQLVQPLAYDQLDNADRLRRLGVGEFLSPRRFTTARGAAVLGRLLTTPAVKEKARKLQALCDRDAAIDATCDALQAMRAAPSELLTV